tara:strand:- start:963 stop:1379 length:417 start_codon:yes stop_codon:yes gene_type:complete
MLIALIQGFSSDTTVVKAACNISLQEKEKITLLYVIEIERNYPVDQDVGIETDRAEEVLRNMEDLCKKQKVRLSGQILQARTKGAAVVSLADEVKASYILVGAEYDPRTDVANFGKTARYILNHAKCDFIVCQSSNVQ